MVRESWASRVGFILAAVGSAVGLGNVWRFPWMTAKYGGSAFLVVYLCIVLLVGVPGLLAEFVIGRRSKRNPAGALARLAPGTKSWGFVGLFGVVTALVLLSFYSVVGGWIVRYFLASFTGSYFAAPGEYFGTISFGWEAAAFQVAFLALTALVVLGGVRGGIEKATKVMMPLIILLLAVLAGWAITQPDAGSGLSFFLDFNPEPIRNDPIGLLQAAAGQALFTLSLGVGTMITYASYLGEDNSLPFDGSVIAVLNTAVGVLAGLVVFPLLFAFQGGLTDASAGGGPGALFVSVAGAFTQVPYGEVVAVGFFAAILFAALSSSISMLEIPVAYLVDEHGVSRRTATLSLAGVILVTGTVCALTPDLFTFVADTLVNLMLTAGLAGFLVFAGWILGSDALAEFDSGAGGFASSLGVPWLWSVRTVLPLFLLVTLAVNLYSLL
ncbi:sodium- and chloride-dependent transporter [Haladaptatus paucihalophilus DX253]|uniref:Neurotransmitter:Na+ symporter, NSS family n=1 Tax=Haladaptatus paucihalophilus DX253 TaxID=797209 RepID=E7QYI1_HALPU|nr:sodium-dependent transporter [Haladaptatus paucihalophilus]EFW90247.1 sodium- and chloride-dependent transporter [Haladaptatus paucihalophilus DX253]SHJ99167.1 neurotransmitter:Na+ symporter, NSS family [Haladaptatus paucihalophilus DX253]